MANQPQKIDHIVQLMLENRSFDQMLGFLYQQQNNKSPAGHDFDGLSGEESNPDDLGNRITVFPIQGGTAHTYLMPGADPGDGFINTNYQLYSTDDPAPGAQPTNQGFVINFKAAIASDLARSYAVCDGWFASVPTETIPNRAFACAVTSQGHMDDHNKTFTCPSIFGRLSDINLDWAIFGFNSDPLTRHDFSDISGAALPLRNQQGFYEEASIAPLTSAADVGNFVRDRTAAWKEHKQRQEARRKQRASNSHSDNTHPHSGQSRGRRGT
jgi:phospholipase C